MKYEQLLNELFKFIKLIPDEILSACVERIEYPNRTERRKYDKYKSLDSKIQAFLKNMPFRVQLIENLYSQYGDSDDSETLSYDEVLSSITATNCVSKILFMLHRCCDEEFDEKYFADFIHSAPFQKTVNNEWEKEQASTLPALENTYEEKMKMTFYLGYIESRKDFYNFIPQYTLDLQKMCIKTISSEELNIKFPGDNKLNLAHLYGEPFSFLKKLDVNKANEDY